MIVYKVVGEDTRDCSNWTMITAHFGKVPSIYNELLKFKKENEDYFPKYLKGSVVKSAKGSVGTLCFKSKEYAKKFKEMYFDVNLIIIKVRGINELPLPRYLNGGCGGTDATSIKRHWMDSACPILPPEGTITFEAVEVLE